MDELELKLEERMKDINLDGFTTVEVAPLLQAVAMFKIADALNEIANNIETLSEVIEARK